MKVKISIIAFMLFACATTYAQDVHVGIKLGANINKIDGQPFSSQFTFGYNAGAFAEIDFNKQWGIQPEVLFNQVNVDTSNQFSAVGHFNNISHVQLKYMTIPILLRYKVNKILSFQLGPQFGYAIQQNLSLVQTGKDAINKGDLSAVAGFQLKILSFRVYGRYVIGLNNLNDIGSQDKWTGQTIQVGVGYTFF